VGDIDFLQLLIAFVILVSSLTFHEAAHAWTADRLGDPTARLLGRLTLNPAVHIDVIGTIVFPLVAMLTGFPLIGWAKPVPVDLRNLRHPRRDFAIVAAAGPISNMVLAAAGAVVFTAWAADASSETRELIATALLRFVLLNVLLAVFNLIPVPPLDGGNILSGVVPEPVAAAIDRLRPWGILVLYGLMLSGVLATIIFPVQRAVLELLL
jgi:Zn-dependent protease